MKKYITIHNYLGSGTSIPAQLNAVIEAGEFTEETRFFFPKNEYISMGIITQLVNGFEITYDHDFSEDNAVFKPREWVLESIAKGDGKFKFSEWKR